MLMEIDDSYLERVKSMNIESLVPGQDDKAALEQYVNEVLAKHRESWLELAEE